jgi:hypothetical protein
MRTIILRLVTALGVLGAVAATASAAPVPNRFDANRGHRAEVIQASYYWHHHHYAHRHWSHDHWHYY